MPQKFIKALVRFAMTMVIFFILMDACSPMARLFGFDLWKLRLIVAIPFTLGIAAQLWLMYCGMERDLDWWIDEEPRRRRRRH